MYDFFIAYATPDRQQAEALCWFLQDHKYKVFLDVQNLGPGASWGPALSEALEASRAIVVLVSTQANDAFYQQEEIVRAIELARDKPGAHTVIPVTLEQLPQGAVRKPHGTSNLQALDATRSGGLKRVAAELVAWLKKHQLNDNDKQPKVADPSLSNPDAHQCAEAFFQSVVQQPAAASVPASHYSEVTQLLLGGKLVPFLGLGIHFEVSDNLWGASWSLNSNFFPSPPEYGKYLAEQYLGEQERIESGMELARIYQFLDETRGRYSMQHVVRRLYESEYPIKAAHAFLASLNHVARVRGHTQPLPLIVTTNLDDVLEQAFTKTGERFSVVSYIHHHTLFFF